MALVSGIKKRHLLLLAGVGLLRIRYFVHSFLLVSKSSYHHIHASLTAFIGAGYNARQAVIAVGSGETLWAKASGMHAVTPPISS